jgi:Mn-dependent DtxR family transcriptional regulator
MESFSFTMENYLEAIYELAPEGGARFRILPKGWE